MSNDTTLTGGCLCGGVRYKLTGELREVVNCFCTQCQKTSGHHVAATRSSLKNFKLMVQDTLKWFSSSDQARRGFCENCGGNLFWQPIGADTISIMAGTIDKPTNLTTADNIFIEDKSDYHELPEVRSGIAS
ncbi:MAG: GFA family protein [Gammaproteobacteria bacterium]|nr:GFA family protein [Gammaproteobacteria bacterium]